MSSFIAQRRVVSCSNAAAASTPRVTCRAAFLSGPLRSPSFGERLPHGNKSARSLRPVQALDTDDENKDKKFLTREEEPEQYWQSAAEKKGKSPLKDPLAIIGILAILFPFIFVLIAISLGAIDVTGGRGSGS